MKRPFLGLAVMTACLAPALASAQEAGKVGVTMGFPAAVGVIWHASEKVAVRPEFSFTHTSTDTSSGESETDNVGVGLSALFYVKKWDNAAMYLAPRFFWSHGRSESESDSGFEASSTGDAYTYSGSVGAQGWIGSRFSVYGEVGLSYGTASSDSSSTFLSSELKSQSFAIRSGVGAVIYF